MLWTMSSLCSLMHTVCYGSLQKLLIIKHGPFVASLAEFILRGETHTPVGDSAKGSVCFYACYDSQSLCLPPVTYNIQQNLPLQTPL